MQYKTPRESLISLRKKEKKLWRKKDEKGQMRDFLFGLINQQTQAGPARGLLRKAKLFSSFTASANHLPRFTSTRAHRPAVRAGSHERPSRWSCLAGIPLPHQSDCGAAAPADWRGSKTLVKSPPLLERRWLLKRREPSNQPR